MSDKIYFNGEAYISAVEAGRDFGVTNDYITQFCRKGEIPSKRVGQHWYVRQAALRSFLLQKEREHGRRLEQLAQKRLQDYQRLKTQEQSKRARTQSRKEVVSLVPARLLTI